MLAVGLCVDQRYLLPSLVTLVSLAEATPGNDRAAIAVRVITTDLSRADVTALAAAVRWLGFASFEARRETPAAHWRVVEGGYISAATYLRFHFDQRFLDRPYLVYLDSDTLVLGDITAPLNGLAEPRIGLVRDLFNHTVGQGPALPGAAERWPPFRGRPYFNAGVMWCHTRLLARLRSDAAAIMSRAGRHIHFNDQDALNLAVLHRDNAQPLGAEFNTFETDRYRETGDWIVSVIRLRPPPTSPALLHFVGSDKPWLPSCPPTPAVRLYRRYLARAAALLRATPSLSARGA
ncbi:glycosyltransferase family 8 protein [Plantactinospora sonchi]|uniref:Glycosyltransferase n=1 Tax=Plantactinospora sonchi TaxID=1544735 RepID=A0ABU7RTM4_9ACTN